MTQARELHWRNLTAPELNALANRDALVIFPVASTEQHGPHLPTGVDGYLCEEVCRRAANRLDLTGHPVVLAPTLWPGLAEHHIAFGGTFSLSLSTYQAVLAELLNSILRAGFKRIVVVNGHGGNAAALTALTTDLTRMLGAPIATTTYFLLAQAEMATILTAQPHVMHACEAETSMMMAIRPDLVREAEVRNAFGPPPPPGQTSSIATPIQRWRSFKEVTDTGVVGDARSATAQKGERLFEAAAGALADRLMRGEPWR